MKILVIQHKMIGDVLTSSILFEALKKEYPNCKTHYLVNPNTPPVLEHNPYIDKLIVFSKNIQQSKRKHIQFLNTLRKENYTTVIDVYAKIGSAITTLISGAKTKISYQKAYSWLVYSHSFKHKITRTQPTNLAFENRLMLLAPLVKTIDYNITPKIYVTDTEKNTLLKELENNAIYITKDNYIMINVLGSDISKTYPLEYMAKTLDFIVSQFPTLKLLLNYIPKQQNEVNKILSFCKTETKNNINTYYAPSLRTFIVLSSFCKAIIGNEGGAINMGKALNKPTYAIFSPWIRKETWGKATNDTKNETVHLKDFKPQLFNNYNQKNFKEKALKLYKEFTPEFLFKPLASFINNNIS